MAFDSKRFFDTPPPRDMRDSEAVARATLAGSPMAYAIAAILALILGAIAVVSAENSNQQVAGVVIGAFFWVLIAFPFYTYRKRTLSWLLLVAHKGICYDAHVIEISDGGSDRAYHCDFVGAESKSHQVIFHAPLDEAAHSVGDGVHVLYHRDQPGLVIGVADHIPLQAARARSKG